MGSKGLRVRLIKWLTYVCSVAYSCQTLRSPIDCSPPGSSVHGHFQARILEWVATSYSRDLSTLGIKPASLASPALAGRFFTPAAAAAKSHQSCPTLCDPIDSSLQGSTVPGILQARTLEWAAISFSNGWKWKVKVMLLSHVFTPNATWKATPVAEYINTWLDNWHSVRPCLAWSNLKQLPSLQRSC